MEQIAKSTSEQAARNIWAAIAQLRVRVAETSMAPDNEAEYVFWAEAIVATMPLYSESRLHPLLSYIWLPYDQP
jgi:putative NADPH-quinone reductase